MDKKIHANFVAAVSANAVGAPKDGIIIEELELKMSLLLQEDILLPVIVTMCNYLGDSLLDAENQYETIFPFDLEKNEKTLCYVKLVENNKRCAPTVIQMLFAMEVADILFKPNFDNVIDLTNTIKTWREVLSELPDDRIINIKEFHNALIGNNLNYIMKNISNNRLQKSK